MGQVHIYSIRLFLHRPTIIGKIPAFLPHLRTIDRKRPAFRRGWPFRPLVKPIFRFHHQKTRLPSGSFPVFSDFNQKSIIRSASPVFLRGLSPRYFSEDGPRIFKPQFGYRHALPMDCFGHRGLAKTEGNFLSEDGPRKELPRLCHNIPSRSSFPHLPKDHQLTTALLCHRIIQPIYNALARHPHDQNTQRTNPIRRIDACYHSRYNFGMKNIHRNTAWWHEITRKW